MAPFSYLLLSLLLLPLLLLLLKFKSTNSQISKNRRRPPGPWTLPIIGSLHHFLGRGRPHHVLRRLSQRYGQLMFVQLGELPTVVVSSKEAATEVLNTHDRFFCNRPVNPIIEILTYGGKDVGFAPYGEYWQEVRKICVLELLSSKRVQSFRSIREDRVKNLIQHIVSISFSGQPPDLSDRLLTLTNEVILQAVMGSKVVRREYTLCLREIRNYDKMLADFSVGNFFPSSHLTRVLSGAARRAEETQRNMDRMFQNIIREQRENEMNEDHAENLLSVLLRLHDEDPENNVLCIDSMKGIIHDVIAGGTATTASILEWTMAELMKNPGVMKKVQTELRRQLRGRDHITESDLSQLQYMRLVIKETLRLHPAGSVLPRECRKGCNILGYHIPKGTIVLVNAWALGRDSKYWEDAENFKPERFTEVDNNKNFYGGDFEYIPFGAGRRICPGISFASILIELVLANLLYHFDWELPDGITPDDLDMTEVYGLAAKKKYHLHLRALHYKC